MRIHLTMCLASTRDWLFCLSRHRDSFRQYLEFWRRRAHLHRRGLFRGGVAGRACLPSPGSVRARTPGCDFSRCPGVFGVRSSTLCADYPPLYPLLVNSNSLPDSSGFRPGEAILAWSAVGYARSACVLNLANGAEKPPQFSDFRISKGVWHETVDRVLCSCIVR